jgi:hypothetical protein
MLIAFASPRVITTVSSPLLAEADRTTAAEFAIGVLLQTSLLTEFRYD